MYDNLAGGNVPYDMGMYQAPNPKVPTPGGGMNPILLNSILSGASGFLGNLAQRIFQSGDRSRLEAFAKHLQSQLGTDVITPGQQGMIGAQLYGQQLPGINNYAGQLAKRLGGVDSGQFAGALGDRIFSTRLGIQSDLAKQNIAMKQQRDLNYTNQIGDIYSRLMG